MHILTNIIYAYFCPLEKMYIYNKKMHKSLKCISLNWYVLLFKTFSCNDLYPLHKKGMSFFQPLNVLLV